MRRRAASGRDASDATSTIAATMAGLADPWPEAATVDTGDAPDHSLAAALPHTRRPVAGAWSDA
jgi:hypothetical protein